MKHTSWWISSSGEGIQLRIKAFIALLIPIANALFESAGINFVAESIDPFIDAIFVVVFGFVHIYGWVKRSVRKRNKLGVFSGE